MIRRALLSLAFLLVMASSTVLAQPVSVVHENGLLTVSCRNAALSDVFEAIEREAGIELTLDDEVKSKRLNAELTGVPVARAVQQILEGAGVNYVVMMDPANWNRVGRVYVGAGGGGPARSAAPMPRRPAYEPPEPVEPMEDEFYDDQEALEALEALENELMEDPDQLPPEELQDEFGDQPFPVNPPGASPVPSYLPPNPTFPRSRFTPGLPGNQPATQPPRQQNPAQQQTPPATYPFTDPFGRPIPVPPELNQQQEEEPPPQQ